jgi:hypothetical protein
MLNYSEYNCWTTKTSTKASDIFNELFYHYIVVTYSIII